MIHGIRHSGRSKIYNIPTSYRKNFGAFSYVEMWKITALLTLKKKTSSKIKYWNYDKI